MKKGSTRTTRPIDLRRRAAVLIAFALVGAMRTPAFAGEPDCDAATRARIEFLESRLDAGRGHARWWWGSWMAVFAIGAVYETVQAATSHDHGEIADSSLSAVESAVGIADLVWRDRVALRGSARSRDLPANTSESCARRLEVAEREMAEAASQADERYDWDVHLINLAVSAGHGGLVAGVWGDNTRAAESFAINEVVSEAQVWTESSRASADWKEYRDQFGAPSSGGAGRGQWQLFAGPAGVGLRFFF